MTKASEGGQSDQSSDTKQEEREHEPRWPILMILLLAGVLYAALPRELSIGPRWLAFIFAAVLGIPGLLLHRRGFHQLTMILGFINDGVITVFLLISVGRLVGALPGHTVPPESLLESASVLWLCNVLLFSLWYWRLDAGGPYERFERKNHDRGAFLFPPMTEDGRRAAGKDWAPRFIDYLFLAFNTSTALSPTDAPVISRWAKGLVMLQATISLTIVVILAARAVNMM